MDNISKPRVAKFLQDTDEQKLPVDKNLWKQCFEVAEVYGIESKQYEEIKQKIDPKLRVPVKNFIKAWIEKNEKVEEEQPIHLPLLQFLKELEMEQKEIDLIWKEFRDKN